MARTMVNEHCADCGYDLTGLARIGCCPECGRAYNADTGENVLHAQLLGNRTAARWLSLLPVAILGGLAVSILGCAGLLTLLLPVRRVDTLWAVAGIAAFVLLLAAAVRYLSRPGE